MCWWQAPPSGSSVRVTSAGSWRCTSRSGSLGAFVGALLSFGDAPFLMRHPSLNPWTLSVLAAVLLVTALGVVDKRVFRH